MTDRHILYKLLPALQGQYITDALNVEVDRTNLNTVQGGDSQAIATELERLFGIVRGIQDSTAPQQRPLQVFDSAVTITASNLADFINRNAVYSASVDQRVGFTLPSEAVLGSNYPAIFEIQHFGGTARFDSGAAPTNTVVINRPTDYSALDPSTFLRRDSATGANLVFAELHRGDTAVIRKESSETPWVIVEGSQDPRSSILPDGVFQLNTRGVTFPTNVNGDHLVGGLSLYTPNQGDAFEVTGSGITEESTFGRAIETGDVIVAKTDDPSLLLNSSNEDWLIIRDAGHGELTLRELRFLAQIGETDSFTDSRLMDRSDVSDARVWLATGMLDHAPFITPSADPDNPQDDNVSYVGGSELDGTGFEFRSTNNLPQSLVYVDVDGSFSTDQLNSVFLVIKDLDGVEVSRHNLATEFRPITLTGSADTYYVFDDVGATDNFSSINYRSGQTLDLVFRNTNREFTFSDAINVLNSIDDGSITLEKLGRNVQALITANTGISAVQAAKIAGLEDTTNSNPIPDSLQFLAKYGTASVTNAIADYHSITQSDGLLPDYERTSQYAFLVPKNINLAGLQKVETTTTKQEVNTIGEVTTDDGRSWIAYTTTLPAITGANSVLDNAWQLDGTLQDIILSGAQSTFKVDRGNISDPLADWIRSLIPDVPTSQLPEDLQRLLSHLTLHTDTSPNWVKIDPSPIRAQLDRQYAALWDENRRTFTGNYFADRTGTETLGFNQNNIFYYNTPNDPLNTSFRGAQSYILNDNIRFRNAAGQSTITSSSDKILSFNYSLQRELITSDNLSMVRVGDTSSTALLGLSVQEGLFLNIGRGDGGTHTRTYDQSLQVDGGQWHDTIGQTIITESEVIIPDNLTGSLAVKISVHLDNNGNDEGTHEETLTISNLAADQNLGQRTFTYTDVDGHSGTVTRNVEFVYDHDNNDLSHTRQVLFVRPTTAFTNPALTYNVEASYPITETWNTSTTYARYPVNAGSGHDDFGLFDPHLYTTEGVRERNRVLLAFRPWRVGDTSADPEMAVNVIVDGEVEGETSNDHWIRLNRPRSDFSFDDVSIGNSECAVSHIQYYGYTGIAPSTSELQTLYAGQGSWLNAFYPPNHSVTRMDLDLDLELTAGHALIISSPNGTRYSLGLANDGTLDTNLVT